MTPWARVDSGKRCSFHRPPRSAVPFASSFSIRTRSATATFRVSKRYESATTIPTSCFSLARRFGPRKDRGIACCVAR